jgi:hypothetical protein
MARLLAMTLDLRPNRRDQPKITLAEEPRERRRLSGSERGGSERRGKGARAESERARAESERRERESGPRVKYAHRSRATLPTRFPDRARLSRDRWSTERIGRGVVEASESPGEAA